MVALPIQKHTRASNRTNEIKKNKNTNIENTILSTTHSKTPNTAGTVRLLAEPLREREEGKREKNRVDSSAYSIRVPSWNCLFRLNEALARVTFRRDTYIPPNNTISPSPFHPIPNRKNAPVIGLSFISNARSLLASSHSREIVLGGGCAANTKQVITSAQVGREAAEIRTEGADSESERDGDTDEGGDGGEDLHAISRLAVGGTGSVGAKGDVVGWRSTFKRSGGTRNRKKNPSVSVEQVKYRAKGRQDRSRDSCK